MTQFPTTLPPRGGIGTGCVGVEVRSAAGVSCLLAFESGGPGRFGEERREKGMALAERHRANLVPRQRHPWDLPTMVAGSLARRVVEAGRDR